MSSVWLGGGVEGFLEKTCAMVGGLVVWSRCEYWAGDRGRWWGLLCRGIDYDALWSLQESC